MGSKDFITEAREFRKKLGGGMRQVGIIASAARYAIENRDNLVQDHKKAALVNNSIEKVNRAFHTVTYKDTNMLFFAFEAPDSAEIFRKKLEENNIISGYIKKDIIRLVFHQDVDNREVESIIEAINYSSSLDIWFHSVIDFSDKLTSTKTPPNATVLEISIFKRMSVKQSETQKALPRTYPI